MSAEPVEAPASAGLVAGAPATTSAEGSSFLRGAGFLALTTVVVSALNYLFSLALARVLPPGAFVNVVAVQSLLLVLGTGVMSAVPWVVSRQVARARGSDDETRVNRESLHFGVTGSLVQGVPVALVAGGVGWNLGGVGLGAVAALSGFALSLVAAPIGFLQGRSRFGAIAVIRLGEAVLRVGSGLTLALVLDGSPVGALAGFPMGSLALAGVGLLLCAGGFPLRRPERAATAALVRHAMWLGGVQVVLSLLGRWTQSSRRPPGSAATRPTPTSWPRCWAGCRCSSASRWHRRCTRAWRGPAPTTTSAASCARAAGSTSG